MHEEAVLPEKNNLIAELTADHREVEEMFERLKALEPGDKQARDAADEITMELVRAPASPCPGHSAGQ